MLKVIACAYALYLILLLAACLRNAIKTGFKFEFRDPRDLVR